MSVIRCYGYYGQGKNCRLFRLLTWTSLIGQFVYPVRGDEGKGVDEWIVNLASYKFQFIRVLIICKILVIINPLKFKCDLL